MKNILVLTKIYPAIDLKYDDTRVVHYFVKEWQKMGYNVKVIHNLIVFPRIVLWFTQKFQRILASRFGAVVPFFYDNLIRRYQFESVNVCRIPILKYIPHGMVSKCKTEQQFAKILVEIKKDNFVPDVVVGHWWSPQLELLSMLKQRLNCKTCMVVHNVDEKKNRNAFLQYFKDIDIWGMRSRDIQKRFISIFGESYRTFLCFSGVPEKFISGNAYRNFESKSLVVTFVGSLISRKHPMAILRAARRLSPKCIAKINFIGDGAEQKKLLNYADTNGLMSVTEMWGRIPREQISEVLKETDVFVMISEAEAFGLVYLEAMGAGCLTVASKDEGMDGIIVDKKNGFLCKAGDCCELAAILEEIQKMDASTKKIISDNAVATALANTDYLAARNYINHVCGEE